MLHVPLFLTNEIQRENCCGLNSGKGVQELSPLQCKTRWKAKFVHHSRMVCLGIVFKTLSVRDNLDADTFTSCFLD